MNIHGRLFPPQNQKKIIAEPYLEIALEKKEKLEALLKIINHRLVNYSKSIGEIAKAASIEEKEHKPLEEVNKNRAILYNSLLQLKKKIDSNPLLNTLKIPSASHTTEFLDVIHILSLSIEISELLQSMLDVRVVEHQSSQFIRKLDQLAMKVHYLPNNGNDLATNISTELVHLAIACVAFSAYFFLFAAISHGALLATSVFLCTGLAFLAISTCLQFIHQKTEISSMLMDIVDHLKYKNLKLDHTLLSELIGRCLDDRSINLRNAFAYDIEFSSESDIGSESDGRSDSDASLGDRLRAFAIVTLSIGDNELSDNRHPMPENHHPHDDTNSDSSIHSRLSIQYDTGSHPSSNSEDDDSWVIMGFDNQSRASSPAMNSDRRPSFSLGDADSIQHSLQISDLDSDSRSASSSGVDDQQIHNDSYLSSESDSNASNGGSRSSFIHIHKAITDTTSLRSTSSGGSQADFIPIHQAISDIISLSSTGKKILACLDRDSPPIDPTRNSSLADILWLRVPSSSCLEEEVSDISSMNSDFTDAGIPGNPSTFFNHTQNRATRSPSHPLDEDSDEDYVWVEKCKTGDPHAYK